MWPFPAPNGTASALSIVNPTLLIGGLAPLQTSIQVGYCAGAFSIGIALASICLSVRQRSFAWVPLYSVLLLIHPAWTMQPDLADLGYPKRFFAGVVSLVLVAILMCQIFWPELSKRRFVLGVCLFCWVGWLAASLQMLFNFSINAGSGFMGELINTLEVSALLLPVAVVMTLIWFLLWLFDWFRRRRSKSGSLKASALGS